jgi:peptidoglycan/xylan/chitin deacetylase (PgdA/CDA1 family)
MTPLVLCYHAVSPTWEHRLCIQPDLLVRQVRALSRLRQVHATFDDAFRSSATVFPALDRLGVGIQIFVCTGYAREGAPLAIPELAGDDPAELATMGWEELRGHAERGIAIGSHAVTHPHLTRLSDVQLRQELGDSKAEIETELGRLCPDLAYPYGEHDDRVRAAARRAGYDRAYVLREPRGDAYALPRVDLYRRHTLPKTLLRAHSVVRLLRCCQNVFPTGKRSPGFGPKLTGWKQGPKAPSSAVWPDASSPGATWGSSCSSISSTGPARSSCSSDRTTSAV